MSTPARSTRVMLAALVALALAFTALVSTGHQAAAVVPEFSDVPLRHKFYTEITWLADQQITTGYANGTFRPGQSISREAFAAFLYRLADSPSVTLPSTSPFKDVASDSQFYREIVWLSQEGITTGWADNTFRPKQNISREAVAAFLYRFEGKPAFTPPSTSPFKDMKTSSKFYKEVTWLASTGITTGYADKTFRPRINVSREATAAFLYRGNTIARGDGVYTVGSQIPPGIYTMVPTPTPAHAPVGLQCWWVRGNAGGPIADESTPFRTIVQITGTDTSFSKNGCSGLTLLRAVSPTATTMGDGMHAVGYHMRTGTYRASSTITTCYWALLSDFLDPHTSIIDSGTSAPAEIQISAGQGFQSEGCGTWTRIGS